MTVAQPSRRYRHRNPRLRAGEAAQVDFGNGPEFVVPTTGRGGSFGVRHDAVLLCNRLAEAVLPLRLGLGGRIVIWRRRR